MIRIVIWSVFSYFTVSMLQMARQQVKMAKRLELTADSIGVSQT
jgi:hypothetical protein